VLLGADYNLGREAGILRQARSKAFNSDDPEMEMFKMRISDVNQFKNVHSIVLEAARLLTKKAGADSMSARVYAIAGWDDDDRPAMDKVLNADETDELNTASKRH
jgi:hypothetical protein